MDTKRTVDREGAFVVVVMVFNIVYTYDTYISNTPSHDKSKF